jgi:subtilisin family serine protease
MASYGIEFIHQYNTGIHKGFAAKITDETILQKLQTDPIVMAISANGIVTVGQRPCAGRDEKATSWGLARVSHLGSVATGLPDHYQFSDTTHSGRGVYVYIIDTGILLTHVDFAGRVEFGADFTTDGNPTDLNGHGTHCTGTAIGRTYGVAKQANGVAVKVLGRTGSGTIAGVVAGIDFMTSDVIAKERTAVGSMSLGATGTFPEINTAIKNAFDAGIPVVVAAGNSAANACNYSPAGAPNVICVGATELAGAAPGMSDSRSSFSNFGQCVHIFGPGRDIVSSYIGASNTESRVLSGTSMACPHVAGEAAAILSAGKISPQAVKDILQATSQKDLIANVGANSPNYLLYNECPTAE